MFSTLSRPLIFHAFPKNAPHRENAGDRQRSHHFGHNSRTSAISSSTCEQGPSMQDIIQSQRLWRQPSLHSNIIPQFLMSYIQGCPKGVFSNATITVFLSAEFPQLVGPAFPINRDLSILTFKRLHPSFGTTFLVSTSLQRTLAFPLFSKFPLFFSLLKFHLSRQGKTTEFLPNLLKVWWYEALIESPRSTCGTNGDINSLLKSIGTKGQGD